MTPSTLPTDDAFEFYPCLVDGAHASIYVNLRYESGAPAAATTRYELAIALRTPGAFGIGEGDEVAELGVMEGDVIARATELGVAFVGRLRHRGMWELTLYGPPGHLLALESVARAGAGERRVQVSAEHRGTHSMPLGTRPPHRATLLRDRRLGLVIDAEHPERVGEAERHRRKIEPMVCRT